MLFSFWFIWVVFEPVHTLIYLGKIDILIKFTIYPNPNCFVLFAAATTEHMPCRIQVLAANKVDEKEDSEEKKAQGLDG